MPIFRVKKNDNYTVMSNYHFKDMSISLKAKGLLSQMLSLPEEWNYTLAGLAAINKEGIDAIREGIKELERSGYVERRRKKNEKGIFIDMEYFVYELPYDGKRQSTIENPTLENPTLENPTLENPTLENPALENPTLENPTLENPTLENPALENPTLENPTLENPTPENPIQLNKDISNKKILNKDILKSSSSEGGKAEDVGLREKLKFDYVLQLFESADLVKMIYRELERRDSDFLSTINEQIFIDICNKVIHYADTISNKTAYINKCIDNVAQVMNRGDNPYPVTLSHEVSLKKSDFYYKQKYDMDELEQNLLSNV